MANQPKKPAGIFLGNRQHVRRRMADRQLPGRQKGNAGGYILAILLLGSAITMGSRLGPLYLDHNTMSNVIDSMAEEQGVGLKGDRELRSMLTKRFKLNSIRDFNIEEHIRFERTGRGTELIMNYEIRMPMVHNLDIIATFNKETELSN